MLASLIMAGACSSDSDDDGRQGARADTTRSATSDATSTSAAGAESASDSTSSPVDGGTSATESAAPAEAEPTAVPSESASPQRQAAGTQPGTYEYRATSTTPKGTKEGSVVLTVTKGNAPSQRNLDYRSSMGDGSQMMRIDFAPDGVRLDGIDSKDPDVRCQLDPPGQLYRSEMPVESEWRWSSACEVTLGGTKMTRTITEKVTVVSTGSSTALKREVAFIELRRERINEFRYEGGKNVQAELEVEKYAPDLGVAIERTTKTSPQADRSFSATLKLTLDSFVESTGG